jgi:hypothetical protein
MFFTEQGKELQYFKENCKHTIASSLRAHMSCPYCHTGKARLQRFIAADNVPSVRRNGDRGFYLIAILDASGGGQKGISEYGK